MKYIKLFEEFSANQIKCNNCEWTWKLEDGGNDMYICHKCGYDNSPILGESYVLKELEPKFNVILDLYNNGKFLELTRIVIPKEKRGEGIGSEVMDKINEYADQNGLKIYLTPSKDFGATSTSRLEQFYKQHGFIKNTDKSETRNTMVRFPKK
jgi:predicted GNAT family acetyltransferase